MLNFFFKSLQSEKLSIILLGKETNALPDFFKKKNKSQIWKGTWHILRNLEIQHHNTICNQNKFWIYVDYMPNSTYYSFLIIIRKLNINKSDENSM